MNIFKIIGNLILTLVLVFSYVKIESMITANSAMTNSRSNEDLKNNFAIVKPVNPEIYYHHSASSGFYNSKYSAFRFKIPTHINGADEEGYLVKPVY